MNEKQCSREKIGRKGLRQTQSGRVRYDLALQIAQVTRLSLHPLPAFWEENRLFISFVEETTLRA